MGLTFARRRGVLDSLIHPLIALLDLVRNRKLTSDEVPLAPLAVVGHDYVKRASSLPVDEVGELASALSSLLLVKSRELTPWLERAELDDLSVRVKVRDAHAVDSLQSTLLDLDHRVRQGIEGFPRLDFVEGARRQELPVTLAAGHLRKAYAEQLQAATIRDRAKIPPPMFLRVEMAIKSLRHSLRRLRTFSFAILIREQGLDRRTTVVYFLAVLDLARKGLIEVRQDTPFQDLLLLELRGSR